LVTSHHLLAVMLSNPPASSSSSGGSSSVVQQLLQELGFDTQAVSAGVAGRLTAAAADEDSVVCEPLGFLHEEFYGSLCAELLPGAVTSSSPCLN
jgi:hypothetical protein